MSLSTQPYKGARDFYPEDKRKQKYMFSILRSVAERYGYEEYDAPILEPLEIYLAKSGEEIVNEQTYVFEDRGGRKVVIRPEMTPTVSRMVAAKRQSLVYPLRWYSIPNLWRYERPQRGRLREHWQLNVDIFGVAGVEAETEVISLVDDVFKSFKADRTMYEIKLNDRQLVNYVLLDYAGLDADSAHKISKLIDRMHKLDRGEFLTQLDELVPPQLKENGVTEKLLGFLDAPDLKTLSTILENTEHTTQLQFVQDSLTKKGITNISFDPTLMRGFDYYSGIVFEVFDTHPENNRAMLGGGRYDGLVGLFGVEPVPTVGFGWGDVTLANFLELHNLLPTLSPEVDVYAIFAGNTFEAAQPLIQTLRNHGVRVATDVSGRKIGDQMKTAEKKLIKNVLIIGEEELFNQIYTLKNLQDGKEQKLTVQDLCTALLNKE